MTVNNASDSYDQNETTASDAENSDGDIRPDPDIAQVGLLRAASSGAGGRPFARVPVDDRFEFYELKSAAFRNWLVDTYLFKYQQAPSNAVLSRVVAVLEARAQFEGSLPAVHVRVAGDGEGERHVSYLDLCDLEGRAVEIRPGSWSVVERPRVHFRRAPGMLPLPVPESGGTINLLRPYVNLGELDFRLFVAWLTAAIRPAGPYPPLVHLRRARLSQDHAGQGGQALDRSSFDSAPERADGHSRPDDHGPQ